MEDANAEELIIRARQLRRVAQELRTDAVELDQTAERWERMASAIGPSTGALPRLPREAPLA